MWENGMLTLALTSRHPEAGRRHGAVGQAGNSRRRGGIQGLWLWRRRCRARKQNMCSIRSAFHVDAGGGPCNGWPTRRREECKYSAKWRALLFDSNRNRLGLH